VILFQIQPRINSVEYVFEIRSAACASC